ncbi:hypothetical protein CRG98_028208 [Punica granatum]|uniref:Uncharacterized protein n=1 Tax=Punica granatum TaxID=22663 RepID=A0A2I0J5A4_PUNGR|nr:hypothetical protein CRG98_028208 [Punica granatum]
MERNVSDRDRICPSYETGAISHGDLVVKSKTSATTEVEVLRSLKAESNDQMLSKPIMNKLPIRVCAHPNFVSSGHACARLNATRLGSVHLPGDARRTHVRRSRHLPFYDPKVEGRQVTRV